MKYNIKRTNQFKRDYKKAVKQNRKIEILREVITLLSEGEELPEKYRNHKLSGNYEGKSECHLEPDWLLVYEYDNNELILWLARLGSHSDLF